ncbi:CRISPR-associated protein, Csx3 family [Leptolyngbya sp. PCC 7375]|nr:CRISPR-associated protein, Csx3 family [Leptolyngbya sp. PCC 7375]
MSFIQLDVNSLSARENAYQTLSISLTQPQSLMPPDALLPIQLPADLDLTREVVIFGAAPLWLHGRLISLCRSAPWIGCYTFRDNEIVVVQSWVTEPAVGDSIPVHLNQIPCPAILIGGPPNSGKSIFLNILRKALLQQQSPPYSVFLYHASWDSEGNWIYSLSDSSSQMNTNEYHIHENPETARLIHNYYQSHAKAVQNLRQITEYLLVDAGGLPLPEKQPLLESCTDYIIISHLTKEIDELHRFYSPYLNPLIVIHSVLEPTQRILQTEPFLEIISGPWSGQSEIEVPECVLEEIQKKIL